MRLEATKPLSETTPLLNQPDKAPSPSQFQQSCGSSLDTPHDREILLLGTPRPSRPPSPNDGSRQKKIKEKIDWLRYYIPVTKWLPHYNASMFVGDFVAGLTVACLLIPSSMSYATNLAHVEPVHGLYAATIPGIIYFLLGTCRQLSVGGEAALSLLLGKSIAAQSHFPLDSPEYELEAVTITAITSTLVGLFLLAFGFARLGFIDSILSRALLRGFITAVACVILIEQLVSMLGLSVLESRMGEQINSPITKLLFVIENLQNAHFLTAALSISATSLLLFARVAKQHVAKTYSFVQFIPEILLVVVGYTLLTDILGLDQRGVSILGAIKGGHLEFKFPFPPRLSHVRESIPTAITISVIGYVEGIIAAKNKSSRFNYSISPNRELVALGTANLIGGFFQTLPAFGAMTRTKLNAKLGARTQMAGLITSLFVLLAIFFLLPFFYYLPKCILASMIFVVALTLLGELPHDLGFMLRIGAWSDIGLALIIFLISIFESLSVGTFVMIGLSLVMVIKQSTYPRIQILGRVPGTNEFANLEDNEDNDLETYYGYLIVRVREPLHFANTGQLKERIRRLELYGPGRVHPSRPAIQEEAKVIVFDMGDVEGIDASAVQILREIVQTNKDRGVQCYFVQLGAKELDLFKRAGIIELIGIDGFHETIHDALEYGLDSTAESINE